MENDLPMVQFCIDWQSSSQAEDKKTGEADVKTCYQTDDPERWQEVAQLKLQQFKLPEWPEQVKEARKHRPTMGPPPGFSAVPSFQARSNLASSDNRLFPDLETLVLVSKLAQVEPDNDDTSQTMLVPSLASLQETYNKKRELEASHAQEGGLSQASFVLRPQKSEIPGKSIHDIQPSSTTTGTGNLTFTNSFNGFQSANAEFISSIQQKPAILNVEFPKFVPMTSFAKQNSVDRPFTFDPPRTVQVEFSSPEELKPKNRKLTSLSSPPRYELPGSPMHFFKNMSIPPVNTNCHIPPTQTFPTNRPFQYGMLNSMPPYSSEMQNFQMFHSPFQYGINPPGFHGPPLHTVNPQMNCGPFINNGTMFYPPSPLPPPSQQQMPYQSFNQFLGIGSNNFPQQPAMPDPNYFWGGQQPVKPIKLEVPPKKILEIRSPNEVKDIPLAANLSDEVKESLATTSSNPGKANSNLFSGSVSNKNSSNSTQQSDDVDSSFDERPNNFSQSVSPLHNDLVDEGCRPTNHKTCGVEISHTFDVISDGMEQDSLEEEERDGQNSDIIHDSLNSLNEDRKNSGRDESLTESYSSEENQDTYVRPRSSTPLSQAERQISGSQEKQQSVCEGIEHLILAEQVISEPNAENATMDPQQQTVPKQSHIISTIDVAGKPLHVFWIEGHPYLEVELLLGIGKLRPPVALKIIQSKSVSKKLYELRAKANPEIFDEMVKLGICHVNHMISSNAKILLVKLYDVSELLSSINVSDASYMKELHSQVYLHPIE